MRVIDIMNENKNMLNVLFKNGVNSYDVRHLDTVNEFIELKNKGFKTVFAVEYLSEKNHISASKLYELIKKFLSEITP